MQFKKVLDDQMLEIQELRDNESRGRDEERLMMLAQVEKIRNTTKRKLT